MKKFLIALIMLLSLGMLSGCAVESSRSDQKFKTRDSFDAEDFIEKTYEAPDFKKEVDPYKDARNQFIFEYDELIGALSTDSATSAVLVTFFLQTKDHVPYNEETCLKDEDGNLLPSLEEWKMQLYYVDKEKKTVKEVVGAFETFKLEEKNKATMNGVTGYKVTLAIDGIAEGVIPNPKDKKFPFDKIIWELYTEAIGIGVFPEKHAYLKNKDDWKDQKNNPYNYDKFTIIDMEITLNNDMYSKYRWSNDLTKYPHDVSQTLVYGTPTK